MKHFTAQQPIRSALLSLAVLTLGACNYSPQPLIDDGAVRLDAQAATAHVSGNTEFWQAGPVYYSPDGRLETIWRKVKSDGNWTVQDDGRVCLTTRTWEKCHYYLSHDGQVLTVVDEIVRDAYKVEPGNQLKR